MGQASGSAAEIWAKIEVINGVTPSDVVGGGASTTLSEAVNPGATQIKVAAGTNIAAGDILKVGTDAKMEFVKVDAGYSSGTTVGLDTDTPITLRHEIGEAVVEVDPTADWRKLGNVVSFTPTGERSLQLSRALSGSRVLSNFREGNYEAGADITVETDLDVAGLFMLHALDSDYYSAGTVQGTDPVNTTLNGGVAKGATSIVVASATNVATGVFLLIGTGTGAEIIKVGTYTSGTTVDLDPIAHPNGLRKAHLTGSAVVEKLAPFTHTVNRGVDIPPGLSLYLRFADIESSVLIRGNRVSNLTFDVTPGDLPTMTINTIAKAYQIFSENIFGTPITLAHIPYVHHEGQVKIDGSAIASNYFERLQMVIANTIQGNFVIGLPIRGAITPGEGSVTGSFDYQYESQVFAKKTIAGTETRVQFTLTYQGDLDHSLDLDVKKAKFGGQPHPGVASKDPIVDSKSFTGRLDLASTPDTDIVVTVKHNHPTLEYLLAS